MKTLFKAIVSNSQAQAINDHIIGENWFFFEPSLNDNVLEITTSLFGTTTEYTTEQIEELFNSIVEFNNGEDTDSAVLVTATGDHWYADELVDNPAEDFLNSWDGNTFTLGVDGLTNAIKQEYENLINSIEYVM